MGLITNGSNIVLSGSTYPTCLINTCSTGYTLSGDSKTCSDLTAPILSINLPQITNDLTKTPSFTLTNIEVGSGIVSNTITIKNSAGTVLYTTIDTTSNLTSTYQFSGLVLNKTDTFTIFATSSDQSGNISNLVSASFKYEAPKQLAFSATYAQSMIYSNSTFTSLFSITNVIYNIKPDSSIAPLFTMDQINGQSLNTSALGPLAAISNFKPLAANSGSLVFTAYLNAPTYNYYNLYGLFQTDGTKAGSYLLDNVINLNSNTSYLDATRTILTTMNQQYFKTIGGSTFFINSIDPSKGALFKIEPTNSITLISDLQNGTTSSNQFNSTTTGWNDTNIIYYNGTIFLTYRCELYKYTNGFTLIVDLFPGTTSNRNNCGSPQNYIIYNNKLFFGARNSTNNGLFASDGTSAGTSLVKLLPLNFGLFDTIIANNKLYFLGMTSSLNYGNHLFSSDGTSAGTVELTTAFNNYSQLPMQLITNCGDKLYYLTSTTTASAMGLGIYDTITGTSYVGGLNDSTNSYISNKNDFACLNNQFYYLSHDTKELRRSDGIGGFTTVSSLNISKNANLYTYNGRLYFSSKINATDTHTILNYFDGSTITSIPTIQDPQNYVEY
jgi:uncharacterized protein involved in tolerance to divalent cations